MGKYHTTEPLKVVSTFDEPNQWFFTNVLLLSNVTVSLFRTG